MSWSVIIGHTCPVTASFDGTVAVWDRKSGQFECSATLEGHENEVKWAAFSRSGNFLASCSRYNFNILIRSTVMLVVIHKLLMVSLDVHIMYIWKIPALFYPRVCDPFSSSRQVRVFWHVCPILSILVNSKRPLRSNQIRTGDRYGQARWGTGDSDIANKKAIVKGDDP